jgi:hypothetical protein
VRYQPDYGKCRVEAFGSNPLPAHTLLTISPFRPFSPSH